MIAEIKRQLPILEAAQRYARVDPKKKGTSYWCKCLQHNERTPSMQIKPDKDIYHCYSCHSGGDQIDLVAEAMGISNKDAIRMLLKDLGLDKELTEQERRDIEKIKARREQERKERAEQDADIQATYIKLADIERLFYRFIAGIKDESDLERFEVVVSLKKQRICLADWINTLADGDRADKLEAVRTSRGWNPWGMEGPK